jgi:hypothetical protein
MEILYRHPSGREVHGPSDTLRERLELEKCLSAPLSLSTTVTPAKRRAKLPSRPRSRRRASTRIDRLWRSAAIAPTFGLWADAGKEDRRCVSGWHLRKGRHLTGKKSGAAHRENGETRAI